MKCLCCHIDNLKKEDFLKEEQYLVGRYTVIFTFNYKDSYMCKVCESYSVNYNDLEQVEILVAKFLLDNVAFFDPNAFRFIRKAAGFSAEFLQEKLGLETKDAIKKIERQESIPENIWFGLDSCFEEFLKKKNIKTNLIKPKLLTD
jgi:hypothetical protein